MTGGDGSYSFSAVPAGGYTISVTPPATYDAPDGQVTDPDGPVEGVAVTVDAPEGYEDPAPRTVTITAAGEVRGGLDLTLVAVEPSPSASPSTSPTAEPSETPSPGATEPPATPSASPTAGSPSVLPGTGGPPALLGIGGVAMVVAGGALVAGAVRRRRTS